MDTVFNLVIIAPCYNEEAIIANTSHELLSVLNDLIRKEKISCNSFILFVNDGSTDNTWQNIVMMHNTNHRVCGINLANNVGHQKALLAGMMYVREQADAVITIDADLQDDLYAMEKMIDDCIKGSDIVYGIKANRNADSWVKRNSAKLYYKIQQSLGMKIIPNHADFRLLSKKALNALAEYPERNLYLRGIIPMLGLDSSSVDDEIKPRKEGTSKYTFNKMLILALDGITSFSIKPLELIFIVGLLLLLTSLAIFCYVLISLIIGHYVPGWASIMFSIWFIGSILTMSIGVVGIYIGKMYLEVKNRPIFTISKVVGINEKQHK